MNAKETVQALYAAYASGDPERIRAVLDPDVVWWHLRETPHRSLSGSETRMMLGRRGP